MCSRVRERHLGALLGHTELNRKALLELGVPDAAITLFGNENRNTEDEVFALKDWAEQNGASVLIVPSEIFTAARSARFSTTSFRGPASGSKYHPLRRTLLVQGGGRRTRG